MSSAFIYISSQEYMHFVFVFSVLYFIFVLFSLFTVLGMLIFLDKNSFLLKETKTFFSGLPLFKKMLFCYFCVFVAFPNKIYVNNNFTFFGNYVVNFLMLLLGFLFSPFFILFFLRVMFIVESLVFGLLYEYSPKFKILVIKNIFCEDAKYAGLFVLYFYGNPSSSGARNFLNVVGAMATGYGLQAARVQEVSESQKQIQEGVKTDCQNIIKSGGVLDVDGIAKMYGEHQKRAEINTPISTAMHLGNEVCRDTYSVFRNRFFAEDLTAVKAEDLTALKTENDSLKFKLAEIESKRQFSQLSKGAVQKGSEITVVDVDTFN